MSACGALSLSTAAESSFTLWLLQSETGKQVNSQIDLGREPRKLKGDDLSLSDASLKGF